MFAEWDFLFIAHTPSFTFFPGRRCCVGFVVKVVGMTTTFFGASSENVSNERVLLVVCFSFALSFVLYYTRSLLSKRVTKKPLPKCHSYKKRAHYSRDETRNTFYFERETRDAFLSLPLLPSLFVFLAALSLSLSFPPSRALRSPKKTRFNWTLELETRARVIGRERERERERERDSSREW